MRKHAAVLTLFLLSACAAKNNATADAAFCQGVGRPPATAGPTEMNAAQDLCYGQNESAAVCTPASADAFVGKLADSATGTAILKATNSQNLRWAPPGAMLTRDYRPNRVTVHLGPDGKITKLDCG